MSKQQCQHICQHMHWFSRYQHFNLTCFLFGLSWRTPFQLTGKDVSMSCKLTKHCLIICFLYLISCQYIKSKFQRFLFFSRTRRRAVYLCIKKMSFYKLIKIVQFILGLQASSSMSSFILIWYMWNCRYLLLLVTTLLIHI